MIVQATNTGADLADAQFDLAIPGGGVGIYNACSNEWGAPSSGWGAQYGGISSNTCPNLPSALQPGCEFRFGDWFQNADNPSVEWKAVTCPAAITNKTGCVRSGETPTGDADAGSSSSASTKAAVATSAAASSSSSSAAQVYSSSAASSSVAASSSSAQSYFAPSSSSVAAPVAASSSSSSSSSSHAETYAASSATGAYSAPAAPTAPAAAPSGISDDSGSCEVQYVYED